MDSCCTGQTRRTAIDFILDPRCRTDGPLPGQPGEQVTTSDGAGIRFSTLLGGGSTITEIRYQSSSCATLTAYSEVLGELVIGTPAREAITVTPATLIGALPGIPPSRQDRAPVVVQAFWSSVAAAIESQEMESSS
ncbi:MAG TPA: iron-sulfur cluster assembly scaffold protein [Dehalococcoidia bacterium]|nr:iron-sulfur cluster assembly scaffold protein [Dehalococcoidia bacterium]